MLGFTAFSEAPLGQAATALVAIAVMAAVTSVGSVDVVVTEAKANVFKQAVVSSFIAGNIEFDANATTDVVGTASSTGISSLDSLHAAANITPSSVVSTFTAYPFFDVDAQATIVPTGASVLGLVVPFSDVDAQATTPVSGVLSNTIVSDFSDVDAQASISPSSTSATFTVSDFADVDAKATITTTGVVVTASAYTLQDIDGQANSFITGIASSISNYALADIDAKANINTFSVTGVFSVSQVDKTTDDFPYAAFADQYNRVNVIYALSLGDNNTVHIRAQNNTIYIDNQHGSNVVYITA